jgi:thiamine kinase-like enzyme
MADASHESAFPAGLRIQRVRTMNGNAVKENHMGAGKTTPEIYGNSISVASPLSEAGLPDHDSLRAGLESVLEAQGLLDGELAIQAREKNTYTSTFPSEIVTCRVGSGPEIRVFLKYSAHRLNEAYGHRGGVGYEANVYRQLLNSLDISIAKLYGIYRSPDGINTWLAMEYLEEGTRMTHTIDPEAMLKAARWMGRFHAQCTTRVSDPALSFLNRYNPDYYRGWVSRTRKMVRQAGVDSEWLRTVCSRIDEVIEVLCNSPPTIIHGEYYPKNILLQHGLIYPVDWESTAIGNGMVDLAMLTEGWAPDTTWELVHEYQRSRWPEGAPHDLVTSLYAARIYVQFRWLGDQLWLGDKQARFPEWAGYLEALQEHAAVMGLI